MASSYMMLAHIMDTKIYRFLTWNVNGLRARMTDIHAHILKQSPDFIAVQETGPEVDDLRGYSKHVLGCDLRSSRGLVMYVKSGLSVTFKEMGVDRGIEFISVCLHLEENVIYITNMYMYIVGLCVLKVFLLIYLKKVQYFWVT